MRPGFRRVGGAGIRAVRRTAGATDHAVRYTYRQARRASQAEGAGESGMFRLIELNAFSVAGDSTIAIALAGTLFFQVPTTQARGQVALFLALTLLPFVVVAPFIGPFLDHYAQGRRWAIGSTTAIRAFLCWILAGSINHESPVLFPAALGCLVASKAYGITKAAATPRLLPRGQTLVKANGRLSVAGVIGVTVAAPLAVLATHAGSDWALRLAFVLFVAGTILAILLPPRVDATRDLDEETDEEASAHPATDRGSAGSDDEDGRQGTTRPVADPVRAAARRWIRPVPHTVVVGLRSNSGLRLFTGFVTLYLAFLLRDVPVPGWPFAPEIFVGVVIASVGLGNSVGVALGSVLRHVRPEVGVLVTLAVDVVAAVLAAIWFVMPLILVLALTAGMCQGFAKLSLDSLIQRDVPERVRTSTFARSETLLQLAWVLGGFVGILMPLVPHVGLGVATALLLLFALWTVSATQHGRFIRTPATPDRTPEDHRHRPVR